MVSIIPSFAAVAAAVAATRAAAAAPLFILGKLDFFSAVSLISSLLFVSSMLPYCPP
jgi:hypothetical protein